MAARRKKRGRQRNRGRFGFLYKLLSFAVILAVIVMSCVVFFRANRLEVLGGSKYTGEQILAATGVHQGDNLFLLNKFKMAKQLCARLPYVDEVRIYRRLPDTLVIQVTECTPAAVLQDGDGWWVVDAKGKILERTAAAGAYPVVTGLVPVAPAVGTRLAVGPEETFRLQGLVALMGALSSRGMLGQAQSFDLVAVNAIRMGYGGRFTVEMPMVCDFERKVKVLDGVLKLLEEHDTGTIDLTRENEPRLIPYEAAGLAQANIAASAH